MNAQTLIQDLRASGLSDAEIGRSVKASTSSIFSYRTGTRGQKRGVPYDVMVALKALHRKRRALIPAAVEQAA